METFEIKIINPKATRLLKGLEDLKLISIKDTTAALAGAIKKRKQKENEFPENTHQDTYPFKPQYLAFDRHSYILKEKLDAVVAYVDGNYIISNKLLNITVWGKTRDEAEEAFAFAFHSLFENFANESDKNLTAKSRVSKRILKNLITE